MARKTKHTEEQRIRAVEEYLKGEGSYGSIAKKYGIRGIRQENQNLAIRYLNETEKYPIIKLCNAIHAARSAYYKWLKRTPSHSQQINEQVVKWIKQHYEE